jgi:glucose-6-phosphate isomerase
MQGHGLTIRPVRLTSGCIMSPTWVEPKLEPIELDLSAAFSLERGFGRAELFALGPQLEQVRRVVLEASESDANEIMAAPRKILGDYHARRKDSLLGQILSRAQQLRDAVDRVVVLAPPHLAAAACALQAACGHPHHNSLSRGERGGRPRIYFAPVAPDNDAVQSLLEILPRGRALNTVDDRWGILALADDRCFSSEPLLTGLFSIFWDALQTTASADDETQRAAVIAPKRSQVMTLARQIGLSGIELESPQPSGALFFYPGVLLAGSVMGFDIVKLLHGAAARADRFVAAPPGDNPPLDFAGLRFLLKRRQAVDGFQITTPSGALDRLAQSLQAPRGENDLLVQWISAAVRHDRLTVPVPADPNQAERTKLKDRPLAEIASERFQAFRDARDATGQFTAVLKLQNIDEASIGQLIQFHTLSGALQQGVSETNP